MRVFAFAYSKGIAAELRQTTADRPMILGLTEGIATAGAEHTARVLTSLVDAGHGV